MPSIEGVGDRQPCSFFFLTEEGGEGAVGKKTIFIRLVCSCLGVLELEEREHVKSAFPTHTLKVHTVTAVT